MFFIYTWYPKAPLFNGWLSIGCKPNLYIGNGCFPKQPFKPGCLGYQVYHRMYGTGIFTYSSFKSMEFFVEISHTPRRIHMEPKNHPIEKENDLPNHQFQVSCSSSRVHMDLHGSM